MRCGVAVPARNDRGDAEPAQASLPCASPAEVAWGTSDAVHLRGRDFRQLGDSLPAWATTVPSATRPRALSRRALGSRGRSLWVSGPGTGALSRAAGGADGADVPHVVAYGLGSARDRPRPGQPWADLGRACGPAVCRGSSGRWGGCGTWPRLCGPTGTGARHRGASRRRGRGRTGRPRSSRTGVGCRGCDRRGRTARGRGCRARYLERGTRGTVAAAVDVHRGVARHVGCGNARDRVLHPHGAGRGRQAELRVSSGCLSMPAAMLCADGLRLCSAGRLARR